MKLISKTLFIIMLLFIFFSCDSKYSSKNFLGNWIEVMPPDLKYIQGFTLDKSGVASSIGMATLVYTKWEVKSDSMILWGKSIANGQTIDFSDTLHILKITNDSLILETNYNYINRYYKVKDLDSIIK